MSKVIEINQEYLLFDDNIKLYSEHDQDCCENHYLSFEDLKIEDFEGLEFDLNKDEFFNRISGYGIELVPIKGHSVKIPGYASNNGYYSSNLGLVLKSNIWTKIFDITECQDY